MPWMQLSPACLDLEEPLQETFSQYQAAPTQVSFSTAILQRILVNIGWLFVYHPALTLLVFLLIPLAYRCIRYIPGLKSFLKYIAHILKNYHTAYKMLEVRIVDSFVHLFFSIYRHIHLTLIPWYVICFRRRTLNLTVRSWVVGGGI